MFPVIRSSFKHFEWEKPLRQITQRQTTPFTVVKRCFFPLTQPVRSLTIRSFSAQNRQSVPFPDEVQAKWMNTISHMRMGKSGYMEIYWQVARAMQHKGLIPLVHGQSQIFRVCYETLQRLGFRNGELLRVPSPDFFAQSKEAMAKLPQFQVKGRTLLSRALQKIPSFLISPEFSGRLDHMSCFSPFLLSTTIGLGGMEATIDDGFELGRAYDEFGLSFVFGQPAHKFDLDTRGNRSRSDCEAIQISNHMVRTAMGRKGYSPEKIETVLKRLQDLYKEALKLEYGQLLVIGTPLKKMSEWTYASRPYGITTGRPMSEILEDFSKGISPQKAGQVRLMLTEESLNPVNGVQVVNLMDDQAVKSFCNGVPLKPLSEEESLQTVLSNQCISVKFDRRPLEVFQDNVRKIMEEVLT